MLIKTAIIGLGVLLIIFGLYKIYKNRSKDDDTEIQELIDKAKEEGKDNISFRGLRF